jgi:carboxylesterase
MRIEPGGEPFFFKGSDIGCLLVHGFPGTPQEMLWLGESLHQQGYSVLGARLFGHATQPSDLLRVHYRDWLAGLEDGYHWLRGNCSNVVLIGFSLGGVLSATFASSIDLAGLVLMAMPMDLPPLAHRLRSFLPVVKKVWQYRKPPNESDWFDKEAEQLNLDYSVQPLHAVGQIFDLVQQLPESLTQLQLPTLLIYSKNDGSVPTGYGQWAFDTIPSHAKELVWIEGSGHTLPRDAQREQVFSKVGDFVRKVSRAQP